MKTFHKWMTILCAALLLLTPALSLAEAAAGAQETKTHAEIITENTKLDMTQYEGKAVFLNFFTEWCPYCMQEMPDIKKIFEDYDPEELQIVLVHVWDGEDERNSMSISQRFGLEDMTFFEDEDGALSQLIGVPGYPTSVFMGKDGNVNAAYGSKMSYEDMASQVEALGAAKKEATK